MGRPTKKGAKIRRKMKGSSLKAKTETAVFLKHKNIFPKNEKHENVFHRLARAGQKNQETKFTVIANMIDVETFGSFKEALRELFYRVKLEIVGGGMAAMVLEQGGFGIRSTTAFPGFMLIAGTYFINFYDARDLGYREGLVVDGKVID